MIASVLSYPSEVTDLGPTESQDARYREAFIKVSIFTLETRSFLFSLQLFSSLISAREQAF